MKSRHNRYYAEFAADHGLLITCGSDFHGKHKPSIRMGEYGDDIPDAQEIRERFLAALKRWKKGWHGRKQHMCVFGMRPFCDRCQDTRT